MMTSDKIRPDDYIAMWISMGCVGFIHVILSIPGAVTLVSRHDRCLVQITAGNYGGPNPPLYKTFAPRFYKTFAPRFYNFLHDFTKHFLHDFTISSTILQNIFLHDFTISSTILQNICFHDFTISSTILQFPPRFYNFLHDFLHDFPISSTILQFPPRFYM